MPVADRATEALRWLARRSPRTILFAGWIVFVLGCYPGYMSTDTALQLFSVRSGEYTDYSPVMSSLWGTLEYVAAGPFPMLALQSGLLLFGAYAILAKLIAPRAAAITACCVLLVPPVFAVMAVIWPDPLMAGALLAGFGALLDPRRNWRLAGVVLLGIAIACRPEIVVAVIPLALVIVPPSVWWRRAAIAVGLVLGLAVAARVADWALTSTQTYSWQMRLEMPDTIGSLRRSKLKNEKVLLVAVDGIPLADVWTFKERVTAATDAMSVGALLGGKNAVFVPITTDREAAALSSAWHRAITQHPLGYFRHRWAITRGLLGVSGTFSPVYDSFGDPDLMAPLHHRATSSDWERGMQAIVRACAPAFRPIIFVLAIVLLVLARRQPIPRALAISGLVYELVMVVLAPATEYRFSHWLVTATCVGFAAFLVARRWPASDG